MFVFFLQFYNPPIPSLFSAEPCSLQEIVYFKEPRLRKGVWTQCTGMMLLDDQTSTRVAGIQYSVCLTFRSPAWTRVWICLPAGDSRLSAHSAAAYNNVVSLKFNWEVYPKMLSNIKTLNIHTSWNHMYHILLTCISSH